jgi:hypothetical protein
MLSRARFVGLIVRFLWLLLVSPMAGAAVSDIYPGDYFPLAPGATTLTLYAIQRHQEGPYSRGRRLLDGTLDSSILALRLVHAWQLKGKTLAAVLVLPGSHVTSGPAALRTAVGTATTGLADLRMGLTFWPINDPRHARYLGLTVMLIAPTGSYDRRQTLNAGENRWRLVFGGGWQQDLTPRLVVELSPELAIYRDNDDAPGGQRFQQRPSSALTGYLRYRVTPGWHAYLGGQMNRGGETRIAGMDQDNPPNNNRVMAGLTWFLPQKQQLILRAARDTSIDSGFRTSAEISLRYQKQF